jgi:hypothetical protein
MVETTFGEDLGDVDRDRKDKLEQCYNWTLQQVKSDKWTTGGYELVYIESISGTEFYLAAS